MKCENDNFNSLMSEFNWEEFKEVSNKQFGFEKLTMKGRNALSQEGQKLFEYP